MKNSEFHSQVGQDNFALFMLGFPSRGYFVDIGCSNPIEENNTYAMELLGWNGLSIDITEHGQFTKFRKTPFLKLDATSIDFAKIFEEQNLPSIIDYLSLDIDDGTYKALIKLPHSKFKFKVITIEHDFYRVGESLRIPERDFLRGINYQLVFENVGLFHTVHNKIIFFEDWWVSPEFISEEKMIYLKHNFPKTDNLLYSDITQKMTV